MEAPINKIKTPINKIKNPFKPRGILWPVTDLVSVEGFLNPEITLDVFVERASQHRSAGYAIKIAHSFDNLPTLYERGNVTGYIECVFGVEGLKPPAPDSLLYQVVKKLFDLEIEARERYSRITLSESQRQDYRHYAAYAGYVVSPLDDIRPGETNTLARFNEARVGVFFAAIETIMDELSE